MQLIHYYISTISTFWWTFCTRTRISLRVFAIINKLGGVILNTLWNITLDIFVYRDKNDYICIFDSIGGTFASEVQQQIA